MFAFAEPEQQHKLCQCQPGSCQHHLHTRCRRHQHRCPQLHFCYHWTIAERCLQAKATHSSSAAKDGLFREVQARCIAQVDWWVWWSTSFVFFLTQCAHLEYCGWKYNTLTLWHFGFGYCWFLRIMSSLNSTYWPVKILINHMYKFSFCLSYFVLQFVPNMSNRHPRTWSPTPSYFVKCCCSWTWCGCCCTQQFQELNSGIPLKGQTKVKVKQVIFVMQGSRSLQNFA